MAALVYDRVLIWWREMASAARVELLVLTCILKFCMKVDGNRGTGRELNAF